MLCASATCDVRALARTCGIYMQVCWAHCSSGSAVRSMGGIAARARICRAWWLLVRVCCLPARVQCLWLGSFTVARLGVCSWVVCSHGHRDAGACVCTCACAAHACVTVVGVCAVRHMFMHMLQLA